MNENEETFSFEDRTYLSPTTSRDEQLSFIDTLRNTQAQNTAQINADTYALGSQLPSNLGGLSGAEETFAARYQRPQTEATVADLRTAAQQSALNQALANLRSAWKKRYNDAVLNYQRRAATPSNNNGNNDDDLLETQGASDSDEALLGTPSTKSDVLDQPISVVTDPVTGITGTYVTDENGNITDTFVNGTQATNSTGKYAFQRPGEGLENFFRGINNLLTWNRSK